MGITSFIDITGKKFGCLLVLERDMNPPKHGIYWICKCDCGSIVSRRGSNLRHRQTTTCKIKGKHPRIGYGEGAFNSFYATTKCNAKKRGLEFTITKEEAKIISKMDCHYCGTPPSNIANSDFRNPEKRYTVGEYVYSGLDRVDNEIGYTVGNVVPCCKHCNQAKCKLGVEEFRELILKVYKHWASMGSIV